MPIDFRDATDIEELGTAAFLRIERENDSRGVRGALLVIDVRGEPLEFVYCRVETKYSALWRRHDIVRHATKELAKSLFESSTQNPRILLYLATEVDSTLFSEDLALSIPVGRVSVAVTAENLPSSASSTPAPDWARTILWVPDQLPPSSLAARLFSELVRRGLILEPFERADQGLRLVYSPRPTR